MRTKPKRLKLDHVMHTKISKDTAKLLRERAFGIGLDVSAYVRMVVESHLESPSCLKIISEGDVIKRKSKDYVLHENQRNKIA